MWGIAGGEAIELFEALPLLAGLDVPPSDRAICGMPSLLADSSPSPSPAAAIGTAAAGTPPLTSSQLLGVILAPVCAATLLLSAASRVPMFARLSSKVLPA